MRFSTFRERYPAPLSELLFAPILFRSAFPFLLGAPAVSAPLLRDVARGAGHSEAAIRTALSRLRASGLVELRVPPGGGEPRFHRGEFTRSLQETVAGQLKRPDGFTLVVFAFATENARERQVVREALRLHGFQRLAQNTYIGGSVDTSALESTFRHEGIEDNVFVFQTRGDLPPNVQERLVTLFDLRARARVLRALRADLVAFLDDARLDDAEQTQRLLYAATVHYRITFVEEPQLPECAHPADYPLADVVTLLPRLVEARAEACVRYFSSFEGPRPGARGSS